MVAENRLVLVLGVGGRGRNYKGSWSFGGLAGNVYTYYINFGHGFTHIYVCIHIYI